jgi:hypothetical protein
VTSPSLRHADRGDWQSLHALGRLSEFLGSGDLLQYVLELFDDRSLLDAIEGKLAGEPTWDTPQFESLFELRLYRLALYGVIRATRPLVAIETGVLHGLTSAFVLQALERNGVGRLHSIDYPSYAETGPSNRDGYNATLPPRRQPGWSVPDKLHPRWSLQLGPSRDLLPALLSKIGPIDFFCHDSEHTYATMDMELRLAWPSLRDGAILVCDNIESCTAFFDFCRGVDRMPLILPSPNLKAAPSGRTGVIRK